MPTVPPLTELLLDSRQIYKAADSIRNQGFFELAMSDISVEFLKSVVPTSKGVRSSNCPFDTTIDHPLDIGFPDLNHDFPAQLTQVIENLIKELCGLENAPHLVTQELCVRQPGPTAAASWHVDRAPKVLTIFGTIEGSTTKYLLPPYDSTAVNVNAIPSKVIDEDLVNTHQQDCKLHHFYFLGAKGLESLVSGENIRLLVHRAPGDQGRQLFLARWLPYRSSSQVILGCSSDKRYPQIKASIESPQLEGPNH